MQSMRSWNIRQVNVLLRYCSIYRVPWTPEVVLRLAARYAGKHARERT